METATLTVTTARDKAVAMTGLSITPYPIQKKRASFLFRSSPSSTEFSNENLSHIRVNEKRKVEIDFVGIKMSVLVFLFGVQAIAKPDKILKYWLVPPPNPKHTLLYHYLLYKSVFLSMDHQPSELVVSITIGIQYNPFIDPQIIITFILLLWKNATPSGVVID